MTPKPTGLILDQLQIRAGQRHARDRRDLSRC